MPVAVTIQGRMVGWTGKDREGSGVVPV